MTSRAFLTRQTGAAVARFRRQRDLSQTMLADMTHMTRGQLRSYEAGRLCPSLFCLVKLLAALEVSWQQFGQAIAKENPR
ncbi:MAG TPA: helix-turn-helix transcriptional regulator [Thermoanaerobaculia bacterium]|nr:helix-turn-helix transcriptional regulator [Thermoanaerobaculia bacterium]